MSEPDVIASLRWVCKTCEQSGMLHLGVAPDVLGVWGRIKRLHEEASPLCSGAPDYVQIEVPDGAEINDPRAREPRPKMRMGMLGVIAGALAMMPPAAQRHMEKQLRGIDPGDPNGDRSVGVVPESAPSSVVPDRVARAAEKRARKADRRRGAR